MAINWLDGFKDKAKIQLLKRLGVGSDGSLTLDGNPVNTGGSTGGGGSSVITVNTITDLQNNYPNGLTTPVWVISENSWYYWDGAVVTDTTPPADVTGLTVGTVTTTSIPLTWTLSTSTDVANYEVAFSTDGTNFTVASNAVNSNSTSYTISNLSSTTNYTVRVVAVDNAGNRSTGVTATATTATPTDTTPPLDVTNLATSNVTSTSLTLSWTASTNTDIASYDVYQGSTLLGNTTNTTYNVNSLSASTSYTFKVVAKDTNGNVSLGVSVTVSTLAPADTKPPTVTISPAAGTYTSTQSVTLSADETATIYYTTDGTTPTTSSSVYSSPISVAATETIKYFGKDASGNSSLVQSATYTINLPDTTAPTVSASPTGGIYTSNQTVTLSGTDNSGGTVTIYYTTDGTTPTTSSSVYSSPISIGATETLKFFGVDPSGNQSSLQSQTYTINTLTTIVSDSFNRADSTTSLGNADTGQSWLQGSGTSPIGISSNQAYMSSGSNGSAWIDSGKSDVNVKMTLSIVPSGSSVINLILRVTDNKNFYMIQNNGTKITCYKNVSGTYTQIGSQLTYATLVNDVMEVDISGSNITLLMSGVQKGQWTDSTYTTQTNHGFLLGSTSGRIDDFVIQG